MNGKLTGAFLVTGRIVAMGQAGNDVITVSPSIKLPAFLYAGAGIDKLSGGGGRRAVPSAESHIILDAIDALPKSIGVLIIDHDMDLVFRFAKKITVLVRGAVFAEGTPKEIGANPEVRAVYLGQAAHG